MVQLFYRETFCETKGLRKAIKKRLKNRLHNIKNADNRLIDGLFKNFKCFSIKNQVMKGVFIGCQRERKSLKNL